MRVCVRVRSFTCTLADAGARERNSARAGRWGTDGEWLAVSILVRARESVRPPCDIIDVDRARLQSAQEWAVVFMLSDQIRIHLGFNQLLSTV